MEESNDIELSIYPVVHLGKKKLILKCYIQDPEKIKDILKKAFSNKKLTSEIIIRNKWAAIPKLLNLGFLDQKEIDQDKILKEFLK